MLEIYDLGVTQRPLGVDGDTCNSNNSICTGGTMRYSEGYGIKASNLCVNNRCFNDPRFPGFHRDGYATNETHELAVGNSPLDKNFVRSVLFTAGSSSGPTAKFQLDRIGAYVHSMTGGSSPQAAVHAISSGVPGDELIVLEPLYNADGHIDYFVAPRDAQALDRGGNYWVVFSEGSTASNASYKLYVTVKNNHDDDSHPDWPVADTGRTKDNDASSPSWVTTRLGDMPSGTLAIPQIEVYAGVVP